MVVKRFVIKHGAYLRGLTSQGTIACTKRRSERVSAKLFTNMGRITNPSYNFLAESKISSKQLSVRNYIVFLSPSKFNKLATSSSFRKGSPKLVLRRKRTEFAMTRYSKEWGLRRVHSTVSSCRKEPSYVRFDNDLLSGVYTSNQLNLLRSYIINNKKCINLSDIMSDPKFLIAAWARICIQSNNESLTFVLSKETLNGIHLSWFEKTANTIRNGMLKFSPTRSNRKKQTLTIVSIEDKIIQEAIRFLLMLIFEGDFSKNSHWQRSGKSYHTALNQIKLQFIQNNWFIKGSIDLQF